MDFRERFWFEAGRMFGGFAERVVSTGARAIRAGDTIYICDYKP